MSVLDALLEGYDPAEPRGPGGRWISVHLGPSLATELSMRIGDSWPMSPEHYTSHELSLAAKLKRVESDGSNAKRTRHDLTPHEARVLLNELKIETSTYGLLSPDGGTYRTDLGPIRRSAKAVIAKLEAELAKHAGDSGAGRR